MHKFLTVAAGPALALAMAAGTSAQVVIDTVTIRNPGNVGEPSGDTVNIGGSQYGVGQTRVCGAVDYVYEIGKYEVTCAQYVEFLNAVAATDTYALYNTFAMAPGEPLTVNIVRSGVSGSYTYSVPAEWANRPVGGVSWADACRFANWMHNGQPTGPQSASTTEDGSYTLSGATTNPQLQGVVRNPGATWALPTEDEWYKAAYHKNNGASGSYWQYPTRADGSLFGGQPNNNVITPDPGNSANFWQATLENADDDCIGPPYWRTPVGEFENSASEYGTFDQGGNIWEWTDSRPSVAGTPGSKRVLRGGSYYNLFESYDNMHAAWRASEFTAAQVSRYGFRLARPLADCNANSIPDKDELAAGTAHDYNSNGVLDECDIAQGTSLDCNNNGVPDEADVWAVLPAAYQWDDGVKEETPGVGLGVDGSMVWLNQFEVVPDRETISAISLSFGYTNNGLPITVCLWSDPNNDGDPADAALLASAPGAVAHAFSNTMNTYDIPDTYVGPVGTKFFVGVLMVVAPDDYPANVDYSGNLSGTHLKSWAFFNDDTENDIDPNDLGAAPYQGTAEYFSFPGNWTVRALPAPSVIRKKDRNENGIPDSCEGLCPSDFDANTFVNGDDFDFFMEAFYLGTAEADFDDNTFVNGDDFDGFSLAFYFGC